MLNYNEIKSKVFIVMDDTPYEVLDSQVSRKQANKPVNKTKLRNLTSNSVVDYTFHVSDKVKEADMSKREIKYLYQKGQELWFCDPTNPKDRFTIDFGLVESKLKYMKPNTVYEARIFEEENILGVDLPVKDVYTVKEAPPNIKGNTASGGGKRVILESGASIQTPFFVEAGDKIVVNIDNGTYIERYKEK